MEQLWKYCAAAHRVSRGLHFALVTQSIHRANDLRLGPDGADFLPEILDVAIDSTVTHHAEISIEGFDQLATGEHPPGMGEEDTQQAELDWRQIERTAIEGSTIPLLIQDKSP